MKTFGEIVFGGNIQLSRQILFNVNDRVISAVLRFLFKCGKIKKNWYNQVRGIQGLRSAATQFLAKTSLRFSVHENTHLHKIRVSACFSYPSL
jgi:hypothetical protein